jgi:hypothetical protein
MRHWCLSCWGRTAVAAWLGWSLVLTTALQADTVPPSTLTALLFYATDGDGADVPERVADAGQESKRHDAALRQASKAKNFFLLGKHTVEVQSRFSMWLKPSPQFPLQLENTGATADGGLSLYWILWQKERLPTKDRELVKSTSVLTTKAPLLIVGPKWRDGRLVFLVRKDS